MSSDRASASQEAARLDASLSAQAYGTAIPALKAQYGLLNSGLAEGGEPRYVADAYASQRTGLVDQLARQGLAQQRQAFAGQKGAALGGNTSANLTPQTMGAQIADQLYGSKLNEGLGRIEQMNKLIGMGMGQSVQAGSAGLGAGQAQLQGIAGLPNYNSTYANVLGGLNLAGSVYGAYQGYRAANAPGLQPGVTLPQATNYSAYVGG